MRKGKKYMDTQQELKQQLLNYLEGEHAHKSLDGAVKGFPTGLMNTRHDGVPYTFWQLLEHIRITQNDVIEFIQNPKYKEKEWPKDYWPKKDGDLKQWKLSIINYKKDLQELKKIVKNPKTDLLAKIPHGQGQTLLREAMLIVDHNAYHIGEFILMRRTLNIWES